MAAAKRRANRHARTRQDHATELAEDYVEAIADFIRDNGSCRSKDLAQHFQVSHVTVSKTVGRLQRDGYVETVPYGPIELTAQGRKVAEMSRRRHKIVYQFLLAMGVSESTAMIDAEGLEHHVSEETLEMMRRRAREAGYDSD